MKYKFKDLVEGNEVTEPKYDVVFIEGNKKYLTIERHNELKEKILSLFKNFNTSSTNSDTISFDHVPKSKVYIGFSQGTRYFKKMDNDALKISIGGLTGRDILFYKNKDDHAYKGDHSDASLESHFTLTEATLNSIYKNCLKRLKQK